MKKATTILIVFIILLFTTSLFAQKATESQPKSKSEQQKKSAVDSNAKTAPADPKEKAEQPGVPGDKKYDVGDFSFSSSTKDTRDPFDSLYLNRLKKARYTYSSKGKKDGAIKHGYELEELRLVGIIKRDHNRFAMMEDLQGKGVLFKKGDPINPKISVLDIDESKVTLGLKIKGTVKKIELEIQK